jgi:hypothetical protein
MFFRTRRLIDIDLWPIGCEISVTAVLDSDFISRLPDVQASFNQWKSSAPNHREFIKELEGSELTLVFGQYHMRFEIDGKTFIQYTMAQEHYREDTGEEAYFDENLIEYAQEKILKATWSPRSSMTEV